MPTNPTPTSPTPDIAAIISETKLLIYCLCPQEEACGNIDCPSVAALLSAAQRGIAPAQGEVQQFIDSVEAQRNSPGGFNGRWDELRSLLLRLSSQASAAPEYEGHDAEVRARVYEANGELAKQVKELKAALAAVPPAPAAGEVGELIEKLTPLALIIGGGEDNLVSDLIRQAVRTLADLDRRREKAEEDRDRHTRHWQATVTALKGARSRVAELDAQLAEARRLHAEVCKELDKASGWVFDRDKITRDRDTAHAALHSLGCRLGENGWERPCFSADCRNCTGMARPVTLMLHQICNGTGWLPITPTFSAAPAAPSSPTPAPVMPEAVKRLGYDAMRFTAEDEPHGKIIRRDWIEVEAHYAQPSASAGKEMK